MIIKKFEHENFSFPVYQGSYLENIDEIRNNNHKVFSAKELMMLKLLAHNFNTELANYLRENPFLTASTFLYRPNGEGKVIERSKALETLTYLTPLTKSGAIPLGIQGTTTENITYSSYPDDINGKKMEFNSIELRNFLGEFQSYSHALNNNLLLAFTGNDKQILEDFLYEYITREKRNFSKIILSIKKKPKWDIEKVIRFNACSNNNIAIDATYGVNQNNSLILCSHNYH